MTTTTHQRATCFCGRTHERAVCRNCGSQIMRHDEPGLMGWFAYLPIVDTYGDGDCYRNALSGSHSPGWPLDSGLEAPAVPA